MPYLTAAHARQGGKNSAWRIGHPAHARPYGQTGLTSFKRRLKELQRRRGALHEEVEMLNCMLICVMRIAGAECVF